MDTLHLYHYHSVMKCSCNTGHIFGLWSCVAREATKQSQYFWHDNSGTTNVSFVTTLHYGMLKRSYCVQTDYLHKSVWIKKGLLGPISPRNITFGTIRASRTPYNLTPESGVGVRVDIFSGGGSGSEKFDYKHKYKNASSSVIFSPIELKPMPV
jgi:hypothetical protein